ncbi:MAG: hypothetical protein JRG89_07290 [Deltaproteobacteria bacterium]|nr:hypothetical protein [Deltaproteobacteria bacterium]MBW2725195.1 hypothetical protein [Deltaproteobacteria bacterium]
MTTTTLLVILGNLLFVIACGAIGGHLVLLARRTGHAPERLLGSGLLLLVLSIPLLGASGMGRVTVGEVKLPLVIAGLALLSMSVLCQSAFVWRTFRPGRSWALMLTVSLGIAEFVVSGWILHAILNSAPELPASAATREGIFFIRIPLTISYAWTSIEGFMQYRMARRRQKLGIGDAVLTNRFFVWSSTGALAFSNTVVSSALHLHGMTPFNHPLSAALLGVGSTLSSIGLLLVFLPPARYLDWIKARSAATAA